MSRFVRQSQLRNLIVENYPYEKSFSEIQAGDVPSHGNLIACSAKYIAFVSSANSGSSVGILDVNKPGKQHSYVHKSCQKDSVYDLAFCPHDPSLFCSGAGDGTVALWKVEDGKRDLGLETSCILNTGTGKRIQKVAFHPSAEAVLGVLVEDELRIYDTNTQETPFKQTLDSRAIDGCWNALGSRFACLTEAKSLCLLDPRSNVVEAKVEKAHQGRALGRIVSGGASSHGELEPFLYSTGFSLTRDREFACWDTRMLSECVARTKLGSGSGLMIPLVIPDTKIVFVCGKGENSVRAMEGTKESPFVYNINSTVTSSHSTLGYCALNVGACDLMGCEVSRVFKLTSQTIESLRIEIPRRIKSSFHEELFPKTADIYNPALSAAEWCSGKDRKQSMVDVRHLLERRPSGNVEAASNHDAESPPEAPASNLSTTAVTDAEAAEKPHEVYVESAMDKRMSRLMGYVPKFKYSRGRQVKKAETIYNMKCGTPPVLAVGSSNFAVTWQGGGGPVFVGSFQKDVGKMDSPEKVPVLNGHTRAVLCLDFSPFDDNILATGSDDCHIKIWSVDDSSSPIDLLGHQSSVRQLVWHPSVANVLVSGSQDCTVKVWDVNTGSEFVTIEASSELPTSLGWNYNGSVLACMDRLNKMILFDARTGKVVGSVEKTHQGAKPCNLTWLGEGNSILTSGCARMGYREFSIWDARSLDKPLKTTKVGTGATSLEPFYIEDNGVVIFTARGENTFHVYELQGHTKCNLKPPHWDDNKHEPHSCNEYIAPGDPTTAAALLPRRMCDIRKSEYALLYRLTPSTLEPVAFSIPRATDLLAYFGDDVYTDTRAGQPSSVSPSEWFSGTDADPVLMDVNVDNLSLLSKRDPSLAHGAMKKAQANASKFRRKQEEEEARAKKQEDAFLRMQHLAVQHEAYNPNLSTGGMGHDQARQMGIQPLEEDGDKDVEDNEWGD